jgi:hypothetical protein
VKKPKEVMEILGRTTLPGTLRGAAARAGCGHNNAARVVTAREAAGGQALSASGGAAGGLCGQGRGAGGSLAQTDPGCSGAIEAGRDGVVRTPRRGGRRQRPSVAGGRSTVGAQ